jgi:ATP phosphoribosyltransferase
MISIALPTGALLSPSLELLRKAGVASLYREDVGRRLLVEHNGCRLVLVRPVDVPAYVDHGAADMGVVGKDVLWESSGSYYELIDLRFGRCSLVLAAPETSPLIEPSAWPPVIRLATKYPCSALTYMRALGQAAEIVHLHGSVELAPLVGLVDAVVDLTETGRTLQENNLRVLREIGWSTARLIANRAALKTRSSAVQEMATKIRQVVKE